MNLCFTKASIVILGLACGFQKIVVIEGSVIYFYVVLSLIQLFYGCGSLLMDLGSIAYLSDGWGLSSLYLMSKCRMVMVGFYLSKANPVEGLFGYLCGGFGTMV